MSVQVYKGGAKYETFSYLPVMTADHTRLTYQPGSLPGVFRDLRPGNNILG